MNHRMTSPIALLLLAGIVLTACEQEQRNHMVGTLERDRVEMVVESNEPIIRIHVADGQEVAAGDLILEQDPVRHQARLAQQTALRDQAAARLAELRRGPREELIAEARSQLAGAEAATVNARKEFQRAKDLMDRGVGQESSVDRTFSRMEQAIATEEATRDSLERLLNGTTVEELDQAEAALRAAEAAVGQAELDLSRLQVRASVAGRVDRVQYEVGERPVPGATVTVILDSARVYARLYVPADLRASVQPGDSLSVSVDGVAGELDGSVSWVSADATFTPYFALTEHDRSRLAYLAEVELPGGADLPSGIPLEAWKP